MQEASKEADQILGVIEKVNAPGALGDEEKFLSLYKKVERYLES
jgi:hypothetical protein